MTFGNYNYKNKKIEKSELDLEYLIRNVAMGVWEMIIEETAKQQKLSYAEKVKMINETGQKIQEFVNENKEDFIKNSFNTN